MKAKSDDKRNALVGLDFQEFVKFLILLEEKCWKDLGELRERNLNDLLKMVKEEFKEHYQNDYISNKLRKTVKNRQSNQEISQEKIVISMADFRQK